MSNKHDFTDASKKSDPKKTTPKPTQPAKPAQPAKPEQPTVCPVPPRKGPNPGDCPGCGMG